MADARERFRAGETFTLQIDLRLVPDLQPIITQRLVDRDPAPVRTRAAPKSGGFLQLQPSSPNPTVHGVGGNSKGSLLSIGVAGEFSIYRV
jgi:hypothetical protein